MINFADLSVADHYRSAQGRVHFINALWSVGHSSEGVRAAAVAPSRAMARTISVPWMSTDV